MPDRTRSCLLYIPGLPLVYGDLRPKRMLGCMLQNLLHAGHDSKIVDFGGLDRLTFLNNSEASVKIKHLMDYDFLCRLLSGRIVQTILAHKHLDFVVFAVDSREAIPIAAQSSCLLRQMRPELRLVLAGKYAEAYGHSLLNAMPCFDALILDEPEHAVLAWAECLGKEICASHLPNIALQGLAPSHRRTMPNGDAPSPCYDSDYYPISCDSHFKHFNVEMSRIPQHIKRDACGLNPALLRTRSPHRIQDEVRGIVRNSGSRAFHFTGAFTSSWDSRDIFAAFLEGEDALLFSRDAHIHHVDSFSLTEWVRAGGQSVQFEIPSGSQRLLEDFYGECFGISQAESVIRGCREAGLHTTLRMQFPSPWDDLHTREETLRLLRRSRPSAVTFDTVEPLPGTVWFQRAKEYGFKIDYRNYGRWIASEKVNLNAVRGYGMTGWNDKKIAAERRLLEEGCDVIGVAIGVDAPLALAAQVSGQDPVIFQHRFQCACQALDIESLMEMAACFNAAAAFVPEAAPAQPLFAAYRIAVGN